ncbi:uncharacterized protein LOC134923511 isoform X2 [Pseudophryne corroboree]|uniref:uncharacterized protein LOC134923511 isoform X2 n=1 Tax=Pseudophryne corroboree TaxID=495146 RepID=UPI003081ADF8
MTVEQIKDQNGMVKAMEESDDKIVLVVFFSPYCGYCKRLMPYIEELCPQMPDIKFKKIDITTAKELLDSFDINGVPDIFFYNKRRPINRIIGPNKEMLLDKLTEVKNQK